MSKEIEFLKYKQRGAYHWDSISNNPMKSNAFVKGRYIKCTQLIREVCNFRGKNVLDLGCGDGLLSYLLWKEGAQVYGIDNLYVPIKFAMEKHKRFNTSCRFAVMNCYRTGFNSNFFDCVVCSDVIEHVSKPLELLNEMKRVLKHGGYGIISTPIRVTHKPNDTMHIREWFPEEFMDMISTVFNDYKLHESHPLFWMEFINKSFRNKILVNLLSLFNNPFISNCSDWSYYALQYIVVKK